MWTDSTGRSLADYPRPSVAVDVALLTVVWTDRRGRLAVALHKPESGYAAGLWCLPGTFVREDELLSDAALRALATKAGVTGETPRQLKVFDALRRDDRGRVLSVAHVDVVPEQRLAVTGDDRVLAPVADGAARPPGRQRRLPYDHDLIVAEAVAWTRERYERDADPFRLLGAEFTLSDLQRAHEAVAGRPLMKDTFRRNFSEHLAPAGRDRTGTVGRPARLYRHLNDAERQVPRTGRTR